MKRILIVSLFFSIMPITLIYLILRDLTALNLFFNNYFDSGKSLFLPFLPSQNLLWFFPKETQISQLSIGHFIDMIIIINTIALIERGGYHYYKKICVEEYYPDTYQPNSNEDHYINCKESAIFFGLKEVSIYNFNNTKTERFKNYSSYLTKRNNDIDSLNNKTLPLQKFTDNYYYKKENSQFSYYLLIFEKQNNSFSINHFLYPQIKDITDFTNFIQQEG